MRNRFNRNLLSIFFTPCKKIQNPEYIPKYVIIDIKKIVEEKKIKIVIKLTENQEKKRLVRKIYINFKTCVRSPIVSVL